MTVKNSVSYRSIQQALDKALIKDKVRLLSKARRLFGTKQKPNPQLDEDKLAELLLECDEAVQKAQQRAATIPAISYPDNLPVSKEHEAISKLIKENQVVIIAGDTGSGKTTQLPKICLEAGLGRKGMIGHTQTRRLATRTVANRISEELNVELGTSVGYKIRFGDKTAENTIIKLMTDGVLLTELEHDRYLNDYEVLIIDEAHERSLNIDFILGFLHTLLQKRKDLKVIITSATIDLERFSKHFWNAPIKIIEGRTYPVEVIYEPIGEMDIADDNDHDVDEDDLLSAILRAVDELCSLDLGDILIFLNGERDIAETADYLRKANLKNTEILPLYARLSNAEQNKVFAPHAGRRIVLATNVAETSITVPGIRYVIDPGTARISRYSPRTKVQRLPIEPISQASANQRKGRCGRVADGICIRLYSEQDFLSRPQFTDPEILRTNLAAVILRMLHLRIGDITTFPFIEPPEQKQINDGIRLLEELKAIEVQGNDLKLTRLGAVMAKLPCDPRLSRMLIEANEQHALNEVLTIVANLSAQSTREYPLAKREAANQMHARFNNEKSDFIAMLNLYDYLQQLLANNSQSVARKQMRKEYLSYLRMREWFDIRKQLEDAVLDLKFKINTEKATYEQLHRSLLCGLLGQLGFKKQDGFEYTGARSNHFYIFPGSALAKKAPKWIMASEITETSKLYARNVAEIDPLWTEKYAQDLIRYSYSDEHWSKNKGAVIANQKGILYGLPVINGRAVNYTNINSTLCRELFIKEGLVNGEFITKDKFFRHNLELVQEIENLEDKSRRRDLLVNDDTLIAFYEERIPDDIADARSFEKWWSVKYQEDPKFLDFDLEMLTRKDTGEVTEQMYPDHMMNGRFKLNLSYNFDPTAENDGVSVTIPVSILNQVDSDLFLWLIPGLRLELFTTLIKVLPKALRRSFVPAPNYAQVLYDSLSPSDGYFWDALCKKMTKMSGVVITRENFDESALPKHLSFYFIITDIKKKVLMTGRNLDYIRHKLKDVVKDSLAQVVKEMPKQEGITSWDFDNIPKTQTRVLGGMEIVAYPALKDAGSSVSLELFESEEEATFHMRQGLKKLVMLSIPSPLSYLETKLPNKAKLAMYFNFIGNVKTLIEDLESLALDELMAENGGVSWSKDDFQHLVEIAKANIYDMVLKAATICERILIKANEIRKKLKGKMDLRTAYAFSDMAGQLNGLVYKGFATDAGWNNFTELERYLDAMLRRMEKVPIDPNRDLLMMNKLKSCQEAYESLLGMFAGKLIPDDVKNIKYMLEELRVSYFAQVLGTKYPVSDKRVQVEIDKLRQQYRH